MSWVRTWAGTPPARTVRATSALEIVIITLVKDAYARYLITASVIMKCSLNTSS